MSSPSAWARAICKKQKGETLYALRCLPFGGFCAMEGEDEASSDPRALENKGFWAKLLIFAAGRGEFPCGPAYYPVPQ